MPGPAGAAGVPTSHRNVSTGDNAAPPPNPSKADKASSAAKPAATSGPTEALTKRRQFWKKWRQNLKPSIPNFGTALGGAVTGFAIGGLVGIAGGPFGFIAGAAVGALIGGVAGYMYGHKVNVNPNAGEQIRDGEDGKTGGSKDGASSDKQDSAQPAELKLERLDNASLTIERPAENGVQISRLGGANLGQTDDAQRESSKKVERATADQQQQARAEHEQRTEQSRAGKPS